MKRIIGLIVWFFGKIRQGKLKVKEEGLKKELTKKCPKCAEEIKDEALVCKFCGYNFTEPKQSERILCSDGSCVGVIDEKGVCNICGKPLKGEEKSREQERTKDSKSLLKLTRGRTRIAEVVGESHYQDALEEICGGRTEYDVYKVVQATLIHEDNNPYDNMAIRVEIAGRTVGYLSKSDARYHREKLSKAGYLGASATCRARILGAWDRGGDDVGYFGVVLDLPKDYIVKEVKPSKPSKSKKRR